jgi:hypothetical protein
MVIARLIAGKLWEAWASLTPSWFNSRLSETLGANLHPEASFALSMLKAYFSRTNSIFQVRNFFAFHYSAMKLNEKWEKVLQGTELEVILGGTVGNNLNLGAELVANAALFDGIDSNNQENALHLFLKDVQSMTGYFTTFLEGVSIILLEKTLGGSINLYGHDEELVLGKAFSEVDIPYFFIPEAMRSV